MPCMRRTLSCLSSVQNLVGWSVFLVLYPGQHYVSVCVHACFHIVLHVFGVSGILFTPWNTCLLIYLPLSLASTIVC